MKCNTICENIIWTIEELKYAKEFYKKEYERTSDDIFKLKRDEIEKYINDYEEIISHLNSSIELRLYKYIKNGYSVTKAVETIAEENYLSDKKPASLSAIWEHYKNLKKILNSRVNLE